MILEIIQIIIAGIFGAIFGSYATLFAHRLPIGESCFGRYFGPKSHCPKCRRTLRTRELIPLVNWLVTLGKCSKCGFKIPRSHLLLELSITILFMVNFYLFRFSDEFIIYSLILTTVMVGMVTDFKNNILPDAVIFTILLIGLANRVLIDQGIVPVVLSSVVGVVFATIFYRIFYEDGKNSMLSTQPQAFAYAKFIVVAAVCLSSITIFILYIATVLLILSVFLLFGKFSPKKSPRIGAALMIPFIWLLIYSPLN